MSNFLKKNITWIVVLAIVAGLAWYGWKELSDDGPGDGFASGNGRIEATEINVSAKLGGRISEIYVKEGDFVEAGTPLAHMQIDVLEAQRQEAEAAYQEALHNVAAAQAQVALRESDVASAQAVVVQRDAELKAAKSRFARSSMLSKEGASSRQELDDDRARARSAEAALEAAKAAVLSAQSAVKAAEAQEVGSRARVDAAKATVERIEADIKDSELVSPRDGRVQLRLAEPGEVLPAGGRVLNVIDLSDVYLTFFLPEVAAGRVGMGSEVRLVLDAAPDLVIPAYISFVASQAQFTPKTVETASERQKLMFRVRAQIDPELLKRHLEHVKTGLPGVAWVKIDDDVEWPQNLKVNVPGY